MGSFGATCPAPKRGSWARKDRAKPQLRGGQNVPSEILLESYDFCSLTSAVFCCSCSSSSSGSSSSSSSSTKRYADAGTPWQCNVCKRWHAETNFPDKHRQRQCSFYRVCLTCETKKPCARCGVAKSEADFGAAAWKARNAERRYCRTCATKMRDHWQPLRGTQASCRILCVAGHARACTEWHATMQHVRVIGVGLSRRSQSEPTRAAFAAPPQEGARASHCRGRSTRNSGNNRTEGKDERAGNTWRDGVIGEGRKGRSRRARASGKWRRRPRTSCFPRAVPKRTWTTHSTTRARFARRPSAALCVLAK